MVRCTEAIRSNLFWNYIAMLNILVESDNHLYSWLQACPCHRGLALKQLHKEFSPCPMAGRCLPQLAAGELNTFCRDILAAAHADVLNVTHGLRPVEVMQVLSDFEFGRQHMLAHAQLKGAYHQDLPLLLAGLCHHLPETSRHVAQRALQRWHSMTAAEQAAAHPVSRRFLEGPHRETLERFASTDAALSEFPDMEVDVYRLALARCDEHAAEGSHAFMKRSLHMAPAAGASLLSLSLRMPMWEWLLKDDPEHLKTHVELMEKIYNSHSASHALGVATHPGMVEALASNTIVTLDGIRTWADKSRRHASILKRIVYHLDTHSRYGCNDFLLGTPPHGGQGSAAVSGAPPAGGRVQSASVAAAAASSGAQGGGSGGSAAGAALQAMALAALQPPPQPAPLALAAASPQGGTFAAAAAAAGCMEGQGDKAALVRAAAMAHFYRLLQEKATAAGGVGGAPGAPPSTWFSISKKEMGSATVVHDLLQNLRNPMAQSSRPAALDRGERLEFDEHDTAVPASGTAGQRHGCSCGSIPATEKKLTHAFFFA